MAPIPTPTVVVAADAAALATSAASLTAAATATTSTTTTAASSLSILSRRGLPLLTSALGNPYASVGKWVLGTSFLVAGMVHVGGVTRLTKSGLSMTDWKPLGSRPPMSDEEWAVEFERYQSFPEFAQRQGMTVDEFKYIFFWEWGHRMLGRVVGVCFAVPWAYYTIKPKLTKAVSAIPPGYQPRLALLFCMGGTQGLVGWWMVRSGLGEDRRGDGREIRVSPYRLATHLGMAAATYSLLVWTGLGVLSHPTDFGATTSTAKDAAKKAVPELHQWIRNMSPAALSHARKLRIGALGTAALTGVTVLSGAFVAGNDAGCAYNTWPWMNAHNHSQQEGDDSADDRYDEEGNGRQLVPWGDLVDPDLHPAHRNIFENTATVQLEHRILGTTTALSALGLAAYGLSHPLSRPPTSAALSSSAAAAKQLLLPSTTPQARRGLALLGTAAAAQMSLGIITLVNCVPVPLAAAHQIGSLVVLTCGLYAGHALRYAAPSAVAAATVRGAAVGASAGIGSKIGGASAAAARNAVAFKGRP